MDYSPREIEKKWQIWWEKHETYRVENNAVKPKFYTLVMFPYPSGAGLHVGHPLGYIAADIYSRYKRLKGFNVLHPMGFDAFGLPAEQYAIQTGQHPAVTTAINIARYKQQLKLMGFSYDWNREVCTSDPHYYKWTQWIFLHLFNHWYNLDTDKAEPIENLIACFENEGNIKVRAACNETRTFSASEWQSMTEKEQQQILLNYRLAYTSLTQVNWCEELGTVLANDEVKDGLSVRGAFPVVQKAMRQWFLRITAYADRLLNDLDQLHWTDAMKDMQRHWIGRSEGALLNFQLAGNEHAIEVFTTRPDTIYGATFIVLAPEHPLLNEISTAEHKNDIKAYLTYVNSRSERDRISEVNNITGVFTGAFCINPFTNQKIPVWISEYVLSAYGTGAIMAVPAHDSRDYAFAKYFHLPIIQVIDAADITQTSYDDKSGKMINSEILNGLEVKDAIRTIMEEIEKRALGKRQINYRMRDAGFSRQRYWGEPFPIVYRNNTPYALDENELPIELPDMSSFKSNGSGESPLANMKNWVQLKDGSLRETDTMPGYAGSSWYFLRYMDPHNDSCFASKQALEYWQDVDLYIGGAEHAVGHLMYARFWHKFLFDKGLVPTNEPFRCLINQGMIQGVSSIANRIIGEKKMVSAGLKSNYKTMPVHVPVEFVHHNRLDIDAYKKWCKDYIDFEFILEDGHFICDSEVEKMSKSKYNVVNPDEIIEKYGADTFRMYEMFLGPIEAHKPWDTNGIDGVFKFLKKTWNLFFSKEGIWWVDDTEPAKESLQTLHRTIKKVEDDINRYSFNTAVSAFMICVNELKAQQCHSRKVLEPFVILLASFAPHLSEEIWSRLGHNTSVTDAGFPILEEEYLQYDKIEYPVSVNGKTRTKIHVDAGLDRDQIEKEVMTNDIVMKWLDGKTPKKIIIVPGRIVNIVV